MTASKSIRDFFRPSQLAPPLPTPPPQAAAQVTRPKTPLSSSLSPPPSRDHFSSSPLALLKGNTSLPPSRPQAWIGSSAMEIQNSDDEGEDSDSSLEDLATLLASKSSETKSRQSSDNQKTPSTPVRSSKYQKSKYGFPSSPLTVLPKYKFDLSSLASHAEKDAATEASSKRVKAMLAVQEEVASTVPKTNNSLSPAKFAHSALLESAVAETEDGAAHRVTRAIMRTEATVTEKRWYFFNTQFKSDKPKRRPFPIAAVRQDWRRELNDPKMRYQTFISGFAEDMVIFGRSLPDEIFLWLLDEVCVETSDSLRASYLNVLGESSEQVERLMTPEVIQKIFRRVGGSIDATSVVEKIRPVQKLADPYPKRDWAILLSTIKLFSQVSRRLARLSRMHVAVMLLRLGVDELISEDVDLLVSVQESLRRLCRATPDNEWDSSCQEVCKMLFTCIEPATLRLRIVECISSTTPRTHDLRRRLAMCFFFNDISHSLEHSHNLIDLDKFIDRLKSSAFQTSPKTDWREVAALISILDVAIDDGRSSKVDLNDRVAEDKFNRNVDDICIMIKDIMKSVGTAGAAFMSRLAAKESLELVSQRIADTIRTKPKPREGWFDRPRGRQEETFEEEKRGMDNFVTKMKGIANGVNGSVVNGNGAK